MENPDINYLCTVMGNLSALPIRVFEGDSQTLFHCVVSLPCDPFEADKAAVFALDGNIGYYCAEDFLYYGFVRRSDLRIVVGPSRQIPYSEQELRRLAFRCNVKSDETSDFLSAMRSLTNMPVESLMQMLCSINYVLNGEKLSLEDLAIAQAQQIENRTFSVSKSSESLFSDEKPSFGQSTHNTYSLEQNLLRMVRKGEIEALSEWISKAPAVRGGILAPDQLRQRKNTFIVTATLASRAAISGGMDVDDAFTLSDAYIQRCELMTTPNQIVNLQYHMLVDFTEKVSRIRQGCDPSPLVKDVTSYIWHHLSEAISTEDMAQDLNMSRTYLSRRFKAETGMNLTDRILLEKTEEAKRLLRYTDKPLSAIGLYLGFSSQSHFSRVFRKYTDMSPNDYRQKHRK